MTMIDLHDLSAEIPTPGNKFQTPSMLISTKRCGALNERGI